VHELPRGTVTFLFTDIEGSTRLLHDLGTEGYGDRLAAHRDVLREAFRRHGGVEVDTQGDAFFVAFSTARGALEAAREAQEALELPVRMGVHTGTPLLTDEGYVGVDVHRAARIAAAGHGGQVLVSAATAALVDGEELYDLGEHRLKDLAAAERIYQLGDGAFPPIKALYRTNLPVPATSFLGRQREVGEVRSLLGRDDCRLLTLTGPGGTGKTRLALQAAAELAESYPDGVFWVPLAPLNEAGLVLEHAARSVGAKAGLAEFVGEKRMLLLLDNFEHLIDAAGDIANLQDRCPHLQLFVTSRELLGLPGEQTYPVPPLESSEGLELFLARARAVRPDFRPDEAVEELCERLDNLPLALELAAARVRILTAPQLLERLASRLDLLKAGRGADPRQRTLRATIEWSHDLLDREEQWLFARLAVFAGGCTLEAAEAVCDADLDTLQSLVDKSLVRHADGRFWMLEAIHEFAREQLAAAGDEDELRRRSAYWFLQLVETAPGTEASLALSANVADTSAWRAAVAADFDNIRAAVRWFGSAGDVESQMRMAFFLSWLYLWMRGGFVEAAGWFEAILEDAERLSPEHRVDALQSLAHFGRHLDWEERRDLAKQSFELAEKLGDQGRIEWSLRRLGNVYLERDPHEGRRILLECEPLARELPEKGRLAWIQQNLGLLAALEGNYEEARTRLEESADLFEQLGGRWQAMNARDGLGAVALVQGELHDAKRILRDCLPLAVELGAQLTVASCLGWAAGIALAEERRDTAARLLAASTSICEREGFPLEDQEIWADDAAALRKELATEFREAWESGRRLSLHEAETLALTGERDG
jgi:predicted ATPase/class 3 adenylate cyclase